MLLYFLGLTVILIPSLWNVLCEQLQKAAIIMVIELRLLELGVVVLSLFTPALFTQSKPTHC